MAGSGFKIVRNDISPSITRALQSVDPPMRRNILRAMGTTFMSITQGNFNQMGAQFRPVPWPDKKDGTPATLKKTGLLSQSFHLKVTDDYAEVSNPTPYAAAHQFGYPPRNLPARPFFPVDKNNRLTPAAEKLIMAAGLRAAIRNGFTGK